jgi:hypothetical protein
VNGTAASTVKTNAANGATFTSSSYLNYGKVNGTKPPSNADKTSSNAAGGLVTGANISYAKANGYTLISGGFLNTSILKVGTAQIDKAAITNAKIDTAAVDTLELKGQAVTIPVSAYSAAGITIDSADGQKIIQTVSILSSGAPINIHFSFVCTDGDEYSSEIRVYLYRAGRATALFDSTNIQGPDDYMYGVPFAAAITDTPGSGTRTYYLKVSGPGVTARARSIVLLEVKK